MSKEMLEKKYRCSPRSVDFDIYAVNQRLLCIDSYLILENMSDRQTKRYVDLFSKILDLCNKLDFDLMDIVGECLIDLNLTESSINGISYQLNYDVIENVNRFDDSVIIDYDEYLRKNHANAYFQAKEKQNKELLETLKSDDLLSYIKYLMEVPYNVSKLIVVKKEVFDELENSKFISRRQESDGVQIFNLPLKDDFIHGTVNISSQLQGRSLNLNFEENRIIEGVYKKNKKSSNECVDSKILFHLNGMIKYFEKNVLVGNDFSNYIKYEKNINGRNHGSYIDLTVKKSEKKLVSRIYNDGYLIAEIS